MALTTDDLHWLRTKVGTTSPTDDDLNARYARLGDVPAVAREVLEERYADLIAAPESFSVSGEYSQSTAEQMKQLRAAIESIPATADPAGGSARIVRARYGRR